MIHVTYDFVKRDPMNPCDLQPCDPSDLWPLNSHDLWPLSLWPMTPMSHSDPWQLTWCLSDANSTDARWNLQSGFRPSIVIARSRVARASDERFKACWTCVTSTSKLIQNFHGGDNNNNNNNNYTNTQDDTCSTVYTATAICESSLWVIWAKVDQRQVAANS